MTHLTAWAMISFLALFLPLQIIGLVGFLAQLTFEVGAACWREIKSARRG